MRVITKKLKTSGLVLLGLILSANLALLLPLQARAAGSVTLYMSPATATITKGNTFKVAVYENSGSTEVNVVEAYVQYSTSKLTFEGFSPSSNFTFQAQTPSGNSSPLTMIVGSSTGKTGVQLAGTFTFKALASSGSTAITFGSQSAVRAKDGFGTNVLTSTTGGTYNFKAPASTSTSTTTAPPATSSTPTTNQSTTSSSSSTKTKTADKTAPSISEVVVSKLTGSSATISWKTSEPATSVVRYGLDTKNLISSTDTNLVNGHSVTLVSLSAGTTYYFTAVSADKNHNSASSKQMSFQTLSAGAATSAAPSKLSNTAKVRIAAGVAVVSLAGLGIVAINMLKRRHAAAAELSRHFVNTTNEPEIPVQAPPTVITPTTSPPNDKPKK